MASFSSWSLSVYSGSIDVALGHSLCCFEENFIASHKNRIWAAHIYTYCTCTHTMFVLIWPLWKRNSSPVWLEVARFHMQNVAQCRMMMEHQFSLYSYTFLIHYSFCFFYLFLSSSLLFWLIHASYLSTPNLFHSSSSFIVFALFFV